MDNTSEFFIENEIEVSKAEALAEWVNHGLTHHEFFLEFGDKDIYNSAEILIFLGY
jgi:hypothetical protein